jgi:hypothetical protein
MPEHAVSAEVELVDSLPDQRLHDAVRRLADAFGSGLPVHELRPVVREQIAQLCACTLGLDEVAPGAGESLVFESLQAVSLQAVVQACLGRSLPLDRLLEGMGVEQITEFLLQVDGTDEDDPHGRGGSVVQSDPAARFEPFPLTDVQQAYLLGRESALELGNVTSTFYAELDTVDLDLDRVEAALNQMIVRHDALRTVVLPDGYQQVIAHVSHYQLACGRARPRGR